MPAELSRSGRTAHRRPRACERAGAWDRVHAGLLRAAGTLDTDLVVVDGVPVRALGGGEQTGPVDRGKPGTKHTRMVDRNGVPLAIRTAGANAGNHARVIPLLPDLPRAGGEAGRPKQLPGALFADRGLRQRGGPVAAAGGS